MWTPEEDALLAGLVEMHAAKNWPLISASVPGRSRVSCWQRWHNQLSPDIKHGPFTPEEDAIILQGQREHGNSWVKIAAHPRLAGRTNNAIKHRWYNSLERKSTDVNRGQSSSGGSKRAESPSSSTGSKPVEGPYSDTGSGLTDRSEMEEDPMTVLTLGLPGWFRMEEAREERNSLKRKEKAEGGG